MRLLSLRRCSTQTTTSCSCSRKATVLSVSVCIGPHNPTHIPEFIKKLKTIYISNIANIFCKHFSLRQRDSLDFCAEGQDPLGATVDRDPLDASVDQDPLGATGDKICLAATFIFLYYLYFLNIPPVASLKIRNISSFILLKSGCPTKHCVQE